MTEQNRRYRPEQHQPKNKKGDRVLNYLIAIVAILIVVVAAFIFSGGENKNIATEKPEQTVKEQPKVQVDKDSATSTTEKNQNNDSTTESKNTQSTEEQVVQSIDELKKSETAKVTTVEDGIVLESIEDENWQAYPTKQQNIGAQHVSSYEVGSIDWQEKITTIATITGLSEDDMTVWFVKNNGGPTKAIGTVSSKNQKEKYRVSIQWIENEGWQAEKVEVLQSIKGAY